MPRDIVIEAVQAACDKWAAVSTFTFQRVPPLQQVCALNIADMYGKLNTPYSYSLYSLIYELRLGR